MKGVYQKMITQFLVTQDRDEIWACTGDLETSANWHEGIYMGVNLYDHGHFLGTFDCPAEAIQEINNIYKCKQAVYVIDGFSDYDIFNKED